MGAANNPGTLIKVSEGAVEAKNGNAVILNELLNLPSTILEKAFSQKNADGKDVSTILREHKNVEVGKLLDDPRVANLDLLSGKGAVKSPS